jgi:hypothetical protein
VPGAVANRVGGQFVHRDDEIVGAARRQPSLRGVRRDRRPQRIERIRVESLVQDRRSRGPGFGLSGFGLSGFGLSGLGSRLVAAGVIDHRHPQG